MTPPRIVAVVGAECVGKTTLCAALADALGGPWVTETLREFCDARGRTPTAAEQHAIFREQVERERAASARAAARGQRWVFCDSAPLITALYSVRFFDDHSLLAAGLEHHRGYAATLLPQPDLPWVADGIQRDGPQVRAEFHEVLVGALARARIDAVPVAGEGDLRIAAARQALLRIAGD